MQILMPWRSGLLRDFVRG